MSPYWFVDGITADASISSRNIRCDAFTLKRERKLIDFDSSPQLSYIFKRRRHKNIAETKDNRAVNER